MAQATIIIDDFTSTNPAGYWILNGVTLGVAVTKSETGLSGVYGGTRDTSYTEYLSLSASMSMGYGWCDQSNGASGWSKTTLSYNGGGGAGGLNLNLMNGTKFSVDTWLDHVGNQKNSVMSLTLYDGLNTATISKTWTTSQTINVQQTQTFLFASFLSANPSINLGSIDSIALYLETDKGGDYSMMTGLSTDATAVPEPGAILAALSILGPAAMIFRRRKSA